MLRSSRLLRRVMSFPETKIRPKSCEVSRKALAVLRRVQGFDKGTGLSFKFVSQIQKTCLAATFILSHPHEV